ncbi:23S rRNA (pseudouridine(1915)-N(3))-methyltransferase RlmH [Marinicrinis sediminis]|uniref:Ribosomal RNA large subunit methyltransferase H n=1 Tax=Marinicrinis sediminis TaxID=1652465 RepID=A0ABW5RBQ0_9BACL
MHITVIGVGKLKEKYWTLGINEYSKRLGAYAKLQMIEVPDEKAPEQLSKAEEEQVMQKEGERILSHVKPDSFVIVMAIDGEMYSSKQLARKMDELATYGRSHLTFIIGGSLGLSSEVQKRADLKLSFGKITYPHQLLRLVLLEQVYRGFKIIRGEPYHK